MYSDNTGACSTLFLHLLSYHPGISLHSSLFIHFISIHSSLAELYSKACDHSALDKTSCEIEGNEEEFANVQECFQEYLHAVKDEMSSQASELSGELLGLHSQEKKARQHVTDLEEKF